MAQKHAWQLRDDDGTTCRFGCLRCMGVLHTRNATPDDRHGVREWRLGSTVQRLTRKEGPPACEGRGEVKVTLQGRHVVKVRA